MSTVRVNPPHVIVTTHYFEDDRDCIGDYAEVSLAVNGEVVQRYGDAYHERGRDRVAGFLDGLRHVWGDDGFTLEQRQVADYG